MTIELPSIHVNTLVDILHRVIGNIRGLGISFGRVGNDLTYVVCGVCAVKHPYAFA